METRFGILVEFPLIAPGTYGMNVSVYGVNLLQSQIGELAKNMFQMNYSQFREKVWKDSEGGTRKVLIMPENLEKASSN